MKKLIFLLTLMSFMLFSCAQRLRKPTKEATLSTINLADTISPELANKMINHYKKIMVDLSPDAILKQITLYNTDWYPIFIAYPNITRIRLITAAYLNDYAVDKLRNTVTLVVQLKVGYNSQYFYYDINDFGAGRICPPPPGCSPNIFEDL